MLFFALCLVFLWLVHPVSCATFGFVSFGIMPMQVQPLLASRCRQSCKCGGSVAVCILSDVMCAFVYLCQFESTLAHVSACMYAFACLRIAWHTFWLAQSSHLHALPCCGEDVLQSCSRQRRPM